MFLEMKVFGLTIDPFTNSPIVILKDSDQKQVLPVWIGVLEASAIASELEKIKFSRPMTHDLMKNMLDHLSIGVEKIEVCDLRDNVYYAKIHMVTRGGATTVIDSRPSDAIALALRTDSPIFVDRTVLEKSKNLDFRSDKKGGSGESDLQKLLEDLSPDEFGKYKQ